MFKRVRCSKCSWTGDELDALWRGFLCCPFCETATIPDTRSCWQRWWEGICNFWSGVAK
jgi:hypothetical protein